MTHDNPKSESDYEGEATKILANNVYANTVAQPLGLTHLQLEAMRLLSMSATDKLSDNQVELVRRFVENAKGNVALNQNLKSLMTLNLEQCGLNRDTVEMVKLFTDKSRHVDAFSSAFDKLTRKDVQHLTLKEYAVTMDFVKLKKFFDLIQSKIELKGELDSLAQKVAKMPVILTTLDEEVKKTQSARPGALLFDHTTKVILPYHNIFNHLVTKHTEAVTLQIEKPLTGEVENMRDYLYSDTYSMKIESLISEKNKSLLKSALGPDWLEEVNRTYANLEREIHDDLFRRYSGISTLPSSVKQSDASFEHEGRMMCSEFAALTTVTALNELDKKLKETLKNKNLSVPEELITIPISKQENLSQMTLIQTIKSLKEKGCIDEHPKPRKQLTL